MFTNSRLFINFQLVQTSGRRKQKGGCKDGFVFNQSDALFLRNFVNNSHIIFRGFWEVYGLCEFYLREPKGVKLNFGIFQEKNWVNLWKHMKIFFQDFLYFF